MFVTFDNYDADAQDRFTNTDSAGCTPQIGGGGGQKGDTTDIIFISTSYCSDMAGTYKMVDKTATGTARKWKHQTKDYWIAYDPDYQEYWCVWDSETPSGAYYYSKAFLPSYVSDPVGSGWVYDPTESYMEDTTSSTYFWYDPSSVTSPQGMTGYQSAGFKVECSACYTDSYIGGLGWQAFSQVAGKGWHTEDNATGSGVYLMWYRQDLKAMKVSSYKIMGRTGSGWNSQYPTAWKLFGSNDKSTWTLIDTQTGRDTSMSAGGYTVTLAATVKYKYYKWQPDAYNSQCSLSELWTFK